MGWCKMNCNDGQKKSRSATYTKAREKPASQLEAETRALIGFLSPTPQSKRTKIILVCVWIQRLDYICSTRACISLFHNFR